MLKHSISIMVLLAAMAWLAYPFTGSSPRTPARVDYDVVAQTSDQGRSFVVRDTTIEPGGRIGWHWHRGTVIAVVKE